MDTEGTVNAARLDPAPAVPAVAAPVVSPRSHWVDLGGPVHVADYGGPADGPLVVCVHGLGASYVTWWTLAPLLARRGRVLAIDLAGFGRTSPAGRRTDVGSNQRLLDGFLRQVAGGHPALLVSNSMGGMISVLQAAANPSTVAGQVLVSPALPIPRRRPPAPSILAMFAGLAVPKAAPAVMRRRRARFSSAELVWKTLERNTADPARVPADAVAAMVALSEENLANGFTEAADDALVVASRSVVGNLAAPRQLAAAVAAVSAPTLLLHGQRDPLVPVAAARHAAARRPDWQVEILDDCGHLAHLEAADRTIALIDAWLDGVGAQAVDAARPAARAAAELLSGEAVPFVPAQPADGSARL